MASSLAISLDVLATANRICERLGRTAPFQITRVLGAGSNAWTGAIDRGDIVIVPGLGSASEAELSADLATAGVRRTIHLMSSAAGRGALIATSCASSFLLAETGLLDRRKATTSWWLASSFARRFPTVELVPDRLVVQDGDLITGGAAMAQMDVMLTLVSRFCGPDLAQICARYLLLDERQSQAPYMALSAFTAQDNKLAEAERWVRDNIALDFGIEQVAAAVALSPRTFARRTSSVCGMSPRRFVQRVRVETATTLLRTTRLPLDEISRRVGYADASTLRRVLKRETSRTASQLRAGK